VGKTTLARAIQALRPTLQSHEAVEAAKVYAIAERSTQEILASGQIPWRSPHHSSSREGLLGGGQGLLPGEISLAHRGILFLDEGLEYSRHFWQSLREPLEEGIIRHARAGRSLEYPADFRLLISANPCPCGSFGSQASSSACLCSTGELQQYWKRMGGPMRDRIAIRHWMDGVQERRPLIDPGAFRDAIAEAQGRRVDIPWPKLMIDLKGNGTFREVQHILDLSVTLAAIRGVEAVDAVDQDLAQELRQGIQKTIHWF
jgi:predicted ATPase with chaperone activity